MANIAVWVLALPRLVPETKAAAVIVFSILLIRLGIAVVRGTDAVGGYLDRAVWLFVLLVPPFGRDWVGVWMALALFGFWEVAAQFGKYFLTLAAYDYARRAERGTA